MGSGGAGDLLELPYDGLRDAVDVGQYQLFLGREMEVDRALADADLPGHVLHGHLAVSVRGQEAVDGIENEVS